MPRENFTCEECEEVVDEVRIDGYEIRSFLEDVIFSAWKDEDGWHVKPQEKDEGYLSDFNVPALLIEIAELLDEIDTVICPKCHEYGIDFMEEGPGPGPKGVIGKVIPTTDLLRLISMGGLTADDPQEPR